MHADPVPWRIFVRLVRLPWLGGAHRKMYTHVANIVATVLIASVAIDIQAGSD